MQIIAIVLWVLIAFSLLQEYAPMCKDLSSGELMIVVLIFMIGAPAFAIVNMLTAILDLILPDDGGDNNWSRWSG